MSVEVEGLTTEDLMSIFSGHDLALLTLAGSLKNFDRSTVPICLPSPGDSYLIGRKFYNAKKVNIYALSLYFRLVDL
jgi:hypothetical protein